MLGKGDKESGTPLEAGEQPPVVAQPGDGPLDFPALAIALEHSAILSRMPIAAAFAMRTNELDAVIGQAITQRIAVRGAIMNQPGCVWIENMLIQEHFDQTELGRAGAVEVNSQRQAFAVDQQHQLAARVWKNRAPFGRPNAFAPFFAGINVASAIATFQSTRPFRSSLCSPRRQVSSKTPLSIHSQNRRQHAVSEGK